jgi:catechol 2,3-dioxygenase-like lactoylglutathione lyase family enzyme
MPRIEHFAIFAHDLDALRDFYADLFGLRVLVDNSRAPIRGYFMTDDSGTVIEIVERPSDAPAPSTRYACHTAFLVEDYDAARRSIASRGIPFEAGTEVDTLDMRTIFFNDPDGNRCQIVWRSQPLGS